MIPKTTLRYKPDYAVPPGETLLERLSSLGMSQAELSRRTGLHVKTINEIIKGKAPISIETSLMLERVTGIPAHLWNNLERNYRAKLAEFNEHQWLIGLNSWFDEIGLRPNELENLGFIPKQDTREDRNKEILKFLGISSPENFDAVYGELGVQFRKSKAFDSKLGPLTAWLRRGELEGKLVQCRPFNKISFEKALSEIRGLTKIASSSFIPGMREKCARAGVAVVFVPELKGCRVNGATRWLSSTKALIQLSLRYKTDDHFWFTFYHEAGHILHHAKRVVFLEFGVDENSTKDEIEADAFASNILIPQNKFDIFLNRTSFDRPTKRSVCDFADELGISPGIVVGRLQHDGIIPWKFFNNLKRKLKWSR